MFSLFCFEHFTLHFVHQVLLAFLVVSLRVLREEASNILVRQNVGMAQHRQFSFFQKNLRISQYLRGESCQSSCNAKITPLGKQNSKSSTYPLRGQNFDWNCPGSACTTK